MSVKNKWSGSMDPYTRAWERGVEYLEDSELLAIIIRTGTAGKSASELSAEILAEGSGKLLNLCDLSVRELMQIDGVGRVKALQMKAVAELSRRISLSNRRHTFHFRDSGSVAGYYMESLRHERQERLVAVLFDVRGGFIADHTVSVGTVDGACYTPREIFSFAVKTQGRFLIVLHNHPSGDPTPSPEDDSATRSIAQSGEILGIPLLDHIIIGDNIYYSYRDQGRL